MKNSLLLLISCCSCFLLNAQSNFIHVDQFGYQTNSVKVAVLSNPQVGFNDDDNYNAPTNLELIDNNTGLVVFTASPDTWNGGATDGPSGDSGWWFDFSSITTPGEYYVHDEVNNEDSPVFTIQANPYEEVLKAAAKMFYYNRCNMDKAAPFADANWTDGNNFDHPLQDYNCRFIYDAGNAALEKDLSGGWFDAGDYNKYITFTYSTLHDLLAAYEANPAVFGDNWNIPESGNGLADILDEIKWELDWMMKMTNSDGSVHIKMGSQNYSDNTAAPPSLNTDQRFYGPTCTSASATVASTFAHAAKIFGNISGYTSYANQLEQIAIDTYDYVIPFFNTNTLEMNCDDGSIISGDADRSYDEQLEALISASIYLYDLTGNNTYSSFVLTHAQSVEPLTTNSWNAYKMPIQTALIHYTTLSGADNSLSNTILTSFGNDINNNWNGYYGMNLSTLYRDFMPNWSYHWGSNNAKASYGSLNLLAAQYGINSDETNQHQKAEELLHAFHGTNPLGLVYLSNMYAYGAENSCNEIYHTWFNDGTDYDHALTSLYGPAPGYVTGGPNSSYSNPAFSPPFGQPNAKSYLDFNNGYPDNSWEITEPAIYYQAAYIRLLAGIIGTYGAVAAHEIEATALLEGPYNDGGMMNTNLLDMGLLPNEQPFNRPPWNYEGTEVVSNIPSDISDWVLLEVREMTNTNVIVSQKAAFLRNDGVLIDIDGTSGVSFSNLSEGVDYHLIIRPRHHMAVTNKDAIVLPQASPYDYTDANNVLGTGQLKNSGDGYDLLLGGDFDSNGVITVADFNAYIITSSIINEYIDVDTNSNGMVTVDDYNIFRANSSAIGIGFLLY